ncbi:hypothetical protein B7494_g4775 [Chlorociboria aeruginascens]|nr:hypothetical protein B7494_g4775 [Chlorociboria aeruginascens]
MLSSINLSTLVALFTIFHQVHSATPDQWRSKSIYQVLTDRFARTDLSTTAACADGFEGYCGGTWSGITQNLDYIQGMGFTAIWISPVIEQVSDVTRGYTGYAPQNMYALNDNFGTSDDLVALSSALHARGMYFMVDVVPNHMAYDGDATAVNYGTINPFNNSDYFHSLCWIDDYNNQTQVQQCWMGNMDYPLPDIATENEDVQSIVNAWLPTFVSQYSIDGLRVDSAKNIEASFFPGYNSAAGVYCVGEVADSDVDSVCSYQNVLDGVLAYASATAFFSDPSATASAFVNEVQSTNTGCKDTTLLGSFSENHDQPRFANATSDMVLAQNIITYTMLADGIPISIYPTISSACDPLTSAVYQGQEQHFSGGVSPYDREALWPSDYSTSSPLYKLIQSLNAIRSLALYSSTDYLTWKTQVVYSDDHNIAFRKGDASYMTLMVLNNLGSAAEDYTVEMPSVGFPAGLTVVEVLTCRSVTVGSDGSLAVGFQGGAPMVFYPYFLLTGTGWCGY